MKSYRSFVFNQYYKDAIDQLDDPLEKLDAYETLANYGLYRVENPKTSIGKAILTMCKDALEKETLGYNNFMNRHSTEYYKWRNAVLDRDCHICQVCGAENSNTVHHIKPFSKYPELRYEESNGITLCDRCHREIHKRM